MLSGCMGSSPLTRGLLNSDCQCPLLWMCALLNIFVFFWFARYCNWFRNVFFVEGPNVNMVYELRRLAWKVLPFLRCRTSKQASAGAESVIDERRSQCVAVQRDLSFVVLIDTHGDVW